MPKCRQPESWATYLNEAFAKYQTKNIPMFLAEVAHESNEMNTLVENLGYTAPRLLQVFPNHFRTLEEAKQFEFRPSALAQLVYGGRFGNNKFEDGYKYRGRGLLQTTFKANYQKLAAALEMPLVAYPERLENPRIAAFAACYYWSQLPQEAIDVGNVDLVSKAIAGGAQGLVHRAALYHKALEIFDELPKDQPLSV